MNPPNTQTINVLSQNNTIAQVWNLLPMLSNHGHLITQHTSFTVTNSLTNACLFNLVGEKNGNGAQSSFNLSMLDTCTTRSPHKTIFSMMMMPPNTSQMVVNNPHYPHKQFLVGCLTSTTQFVVQESPPFHSSSLSHIAASAPMLLADLWQMTLF